MNNRGRCQSQSTGRSLAVHEKDGDTGVICECSDGIGVFLAIIQVDPSDCVLIQSGLDYDEGIPPSGKNKVFGRRRMRLSTEDVLDEQGDL
jgi:hypothetical protein